MAKRKRPTAKSHPYYWPTWFLVGLGWLIGQLPLRLLLKIGQGIGVLFWMAGGTRKQIILTNIRLCFPELSEQKQWALARETMLSTGEAMTEVLGSYFNRRIKPEQNLETEGFEHIQKAQARGQGILLLGMHFNTIDMANRLIPSLMRVNGVYKPNKNPVIDWIISRGRSKNIGRYIDRKDMRSMIRSLRSGEAVWYAPDQFYGLKHAVFVPFFGVQTATIAATSRLAKMGKAVVIPVAHFRLPGGRYRISFSPPLADFPSGDDEIDTARINAAIEEQVRRAPEQYLWAHRRFKKMPDGSNPYGTASK